LIFRYNVKCFSLQQWERPMGIPYNAGAALHRKQMNSYEVFAVYISCSI
jgi:hypothetical protein